MQGVGTPAYGFNTPNSPGWGAFTPGGYAGMIHQLYVHVVKL